MRPLANLRSRVSALVPARLRLRRTMARMLQQWRELGEVQPRLAAGLPAARVFIIPSDTRTLTGARGDEAMMRAIADTLRRRNAALSVSVLSGGDVGDAAAHALDFDPVREGPCFADTVRSIRATRPDALVVVGADMMDGFYSAQVSAMRLLAADRLTRDGVPSVVTGFSFNLNPDPLLAPIYNSLDPRVELCVRDPISLARLRAFCRAPALPVADVAFLLEPDATSARALAIARWAQSRRQHGDRVFAFNLHASLLRGAAPAELQQLLHRAASALVATSAAQAVSWLLLAHDFRGVQGCSTSLAVVEQLARASLGERLLRPTDELSAAELKAITGAVDGVVTGRMHLAIAALGQGTPVACLTYQDKFQGLLDHFGLPHSLALSPQQALQAGALEALLRDFVRQADRHRQQVEHRLGTVQKLAALNLAALDGAGNTARAA